MKRPYLPLVAVYFTQQSGLSIEQIGMVAAFTAITRMVAEIPSGYMSDRWSRKRTIMVAGVCGTLSMSVLITMQSFTGALISMFFESIAYAFLSGTVQASLHDSLDILQRPKDYTKISSRAQSTGLFVNVAVITVTTATYAIDPRLPFVIGALHFAAMFVVGTVLTDFKHEHDTEDPADIPSRKGIAYLKTHRSFITYAVIAGVFGASLLSPNNFQNLALVAAGLDPEKLGLLFAMGSLVGAVVGRYTHVLKSLSIRTYALIDVCFGSASLLLYASGALPLMFIGFIVGMSFWRYRNIIYEERVFQAYRTKHKATLLSVVQNIEQLSVAVQAAILGVIIGLTSLSAGLFVAAMVTAVLGGAHIVSASHFLQAKNEPK